ncbi:DinB family protein [Exiguobacterium artemiae]|uniref:DinB family protein n=1 Tax=Exiguobacterium artemiae TaxID=340145 RepID=UPI003D0919BB
MTGIDCLLYLHQELDRYTEDQIHHISQPGVWSLGQMYDHILLVAHEYMDEVELCASLSTDTTDGKTPFGEELFRQNAFPPIKIKLPDEMNAPPDNTDSRDRLRQRLLELIERMEDGSKRLGHINPQRKTRHGGFGWLNAKEWYQLIEMHTRHHFRQKKELEHVLLS